MFRYLILICLSCVGCATSSPVAPVVNVVTAIPTADVTTTPTSVGIEIDTQEFCEVDDDEVSLPDYVASDNGWIHSEGSHLVKGSERFTVYGINYYPRMSPFELFLTDTEADVMAEELDVITPSGINTLRIVISLDQLFLCETDAVPNPDTFAVLDNIIQTIADKNLYVIVVLHQSITNPEQTAWERLQFVTQRYVQEPSILAWDVLENGDKLYAEMSSEVVLTWLTRAIQAIRQVDSDHLITASWQTDAKDTIEWVDIISFQHFADYSSLRQEIANLKSLTHKPIILSAIGFSTFDIDETAQRNLLFQAMEEVRNNDLAGWGIYMAFDYPTSVTCKEPDCPAEPASINYYGIWNTSYFPKLAVDAVERVTGVVEVEE